MTKNLRSEEAYERFERATEWPMLAASVYFAVALILLETASLSEVWRSRLDASLWFAWALFVAQFLGLLYLAPNRLLMVRTHVVDLIIIVVPFLRPLRLLRLLRLFSAGARAGKALDQIVGRPGFRPFLLLVLLVIVAGAGLLYSVERGEPSSNVTTFEDALWWAVVTATTVGYGDHFPVTTAGRGIAVVMMLVGISVFSVVTANVAAFFVKEEEGPNAELKAQLDRIERMLLEQGRAAAAENVGGPQRAST